MVNMKKLLIGESMSPEEKERSRNERARALAEKIAREAESAANKRSAKRRAKIQKKAAKETQLKPKIPKKCRLQLVSYIQKVKYSEDDLRKFLIQYCQKYSVETLSRSCGPIDGENVFLAAVFHCQPLKLKVLIEILGPEHARDFCKSGRTKAGETILHLATDVTLRNSPQVRLDTVKILFALLGHDIEELSKVMMCVETEFNVDDNPELSESMRFKSKKRPQKGIKIDEINARLLANKTDSDEHREILDIFMSSKTYRMNHPGIELNYVNHRAAAGPANDDTSQNTESNIQGSDEIESGSLISLPAPPSYENTIGGDEDKPGSDSSNKNQSSTGSTSSVGSQSDSDEGSDSDSSKVLSLNESCDVGQTIHEYDKKEKIARLIQEKEEVLLRMGVQLNRNLILRQQLARLQQIETENQMRASTASSSMMAMADEAQERSDVGNAQTHPLDQYLARIGEEQPELPVVVSAVDTLENQTVTGTERFDTTSIQGSQQWLSVLGFLIMLIHLSIRSENVRTAAASEENGGLNSLQNVQTPEAGSAGQSDEQSDSGEQSANNMSTRLGWDLD